MRTDSNSSQLRGCAAVELPDAAPVADAALTCVHSGSEGSSSCSESVATTAAADAGDVAAAASCAGPAAELLRPAVVAHEVYVASSSNGNSSSNNSHNTSTTGSAAISRVASAPEVAVDDCTAVTAASSNSSSSCVNAAVPAVNDAPDQAVVEAHTGVYVKWLCCTVLSRLLRAELQQLCSQFVCYHAHVHTCVHLDVCLQMWWRCHWLQQRRNQHQQALVWSSLAVYQVAV